MHLALEEGCLKAGQRYWACFALRQVASRLSADSMRRLLASDAQHSPRIEDGAILLVGSQPIYNTNLTGPVASCGSHTCFALIVSAQTAPFDECRPFP